MNEALATLEPLSADELQSDDNALRALAAAETVSPLPLVQDVQSALPDKGVTVGLHRLLARVLADAGQAGEADRVLLQVVEKLNQAGHWKSVAHLARGLLERDAHTAGPLLLRARLQAGADAVPDDDLLAARRALPRHGMLAWTATQALQASGRVDEAVSTGIDALGELLEDRNYDKADEALLFLVESDRPEATPAFAHALQVMARQGEWGRFEALFDLAGERLASPAGAEIAWPVVRELWLKHPRPESLRPRVVEVCEGALQQFPDPEGLIRVSRINIPSEEPKACLERLRKAVLFPPGHFALHNAWGLGPIRDNDTEAVVIDFPSKPVHRMTLATAERALESLPPTDLRVLKEKDPDELKRLLREEPATVVARTLVRFRDDTAKVDQLRKILVPDILPATGWAGWWKSARTQVVRDERIDARRAYEKVFRLRQPGDEPAEAELPTWNTRGDALKNLAVLETYLGQHPDSGPRLAEAFGDRLADVVKSRKRSRPERVAAALWMEQLGLEPTETPESLVDLDFDMNRLPKTRQLEVVERLTGAGARAAALNSRLAAVRSIAWEGLAGDPARGETLGAILADATSLPEATLFLLTDAVDDVRESLPGGATRPLLEAFLDLAETPPRETHRKRVMALAEGGTDFARALADDPVHEDDSAWVVGRLKNWRASDTIRFPLLDFLRSVGHGHVADDVEGHRVRSAAKLGARVVETDAEPFGGDTVLSRRSLERIEEERTRVGMELKTTIPRAIDKARELGDLKENAEYHAAKEKQAAYARRFEELEGMLRSVRLLEDLDRGEGVAYPGTEVTVEEIGGGATRTIWILSEGDQDLGDNVVSWNASVGLALFERGEGDTVELPAEDGPRPHRIVSIRERLP